MPTNRDALLDAAIHCLQVRGYAHTSARDLVAESGTNLGAIGYHFGSKEALINEAITEVVRRWIDALGTLVRSHVASGSGLSAVLDELFAAVREYQPLVTAFLDALAQAGRADELRGQLAAHYERFRGDVTDAFGPLLNVGSTGGNQRAASSLLLALADGLIIQCVLDPENIPTSTELLESLSALARLGELD